MSYIVSITSQGQISIPAKLRSELALDESKKAIVTAEKGKIVIEPVRDFLQLRGSFKSNIKATPKQIREAFERYLAGEAVKGM